MRELAWMVAGFRDVVGILTYQISVGLAMYNNCNSKRKMNPHQFDPLTKVTPVVIDSFDQIPDKDKW